MFKDIDFNEIENLISANAMFDSAITNIIKNITETENQLFYDACIELHLDPDIVIKQAALIIKLQDTIDKLGNYIVGNNFSDYFRIIRKEENENGCC